MNTPLPDDIDALKALLREQQAVSQRFEREIEKLKAQIDKLRRMLFGQSPEKQRVKTERQLRQAEKQLTELESQLRNTRFGLPDTGAAELSPQKADHPGRKPLPAGLPRETRVLPPAESVCPRCGGELKLLSESVSEQLDIIRSAFKVIETVRPKLACCRCDHIVQAHLPAKPIARGYAAPGLLAHIIMAKFCEHLPLYRQSEIYARQGVELSRNTLGRWVDEMGHTLRPLYEALYNYVQVHADDTPVNVLAPGSGKTRTGRLWVYLRDDRCAGSPLPAAVWFTYTPDRKGTHPQRHLAGYRGILQADAYAGYDALYEDGRITEAACMAHARRKIHDVHVRTPAAVTTEALGRIGLLYAVEAEIRGSPAEERLSVRKARTVPLMQSLYDWIQVQMTTLSRHSDTAKALRIC